MVYMNLLGSNVFGEMLHEKHSIRTDLDKKASGWIHFLYNQLQTYNGEPRDTIYKIESKLAE